MTDVPNTQETEKLPNKPFELKHGQAAIVFSEIDGGFNVEVIDNIPQDVPTILVAAIRGVMVAFGEDTDGMLLKGYKAETGAHQAPDRLQ